MDVSCSECDEEVAFFEAVSYTIVSGGDFAYDFGPCVAIGVDGIDDGLCRNTLDGQFAGGVNVCDKHLVGGLKRFAKIIGQLLCSAVSVRLENDNETLMFQGTSGLQGGGNFCRVVAVVVNDPQFGREVFVFKAPFGSRKGGKGAGGELEIDFSGVCYRDGG